MKLVFVVPYRNRHQHKFFFLKHMNFLLEDYPRDSFCILFVHQADARHFNRGAMKNIGFLVAKRLFPNTYKEITFVFHDIDTLPFHKLFKYETSPSVVKHFYGFETALGGIFAIRGADFEKANGFPNFWSWGMEDACMQHRCLANKMSIDRSTFYSIGSPDILQFFDGVNRLINKRDLRKAGVDNFRDGVATIYRLNYTEGASSNPIDNKYVFDTTMDTKFINVTSFITLTVPTKDQYYEYDIRDPGLKSAAPTTTFDDKDWTKIPQHYMTERLLRPRTLKPAAETPTKNFIGR